MTLFRFTFAAMASHCEIAIAGLDEGLAERAASAAEAEVRRIEAKYSRFRADSVLGLINARAHLEPVPVDAETDSLLSYADRLHGLSQGLFDATTGPLQAAWDFVAQRVPAPDELALALARVGWRHVKREGGTIAFDTPDIRIDLGGIGKEYAADRAGLVLWEAGAKSSYVNLGGDIRAVGPKPDGAPWRFGIRHPRDPQALLASIPLASGGLATSGDYERFFERDGRRYCHILSPTTGMPVEHWQSVSVIAPLAITAGAMATIAMLSQGDALTFLRSSGHAFLAVDRDGGIHTQKDGN